jgi:hypothetical protein
MFQTVDAAVKGGNPQSLVAIFRDIVHVVATEGIRVGGGVPERLDGEGTVTPFFHSVQSVGFAS